MNIAIVDDLAEEREKIKLYLSEYRGISGLVYDISTFESAEEFLKNYRSYMYSLVFMDIYMDKTTGIEAAEYLRGKESDTVIVFLTTSREHMPEAFSVHAYDYLIKPVDEVRFFRLMDGITEKFSHTSQCLNIPAPGRDVLTHYSDIAAVSSEGHSITLQDIRGNSCTARMKFSSIEEALLKDNRFLRINRGIVVNMDNVSDISDGICSLRNGSTLPVNVRGRKQIEQTYANYMFAKIRSDAMRRAENENE